MIPDYLGYVAFDWAIAASSGIVYQNDFHLEQAKIGNGICLCCRQCSEAFTCRSFEKSGWKLWRPWRNVEWRHLDI
jgi:hypothetical protein